MVTKSELTEEHPSDNINYEVRMWDLKKAGLGDMSQEGLRPGDGYSLRSELRLEPKMISTLNG